MAPLLSVSLRSCHYYHHPSLSLSCSRSTLKTLLSFIVSTKPFSSKNPSLTMSKLPSAFVALMSNARVAASKKKPQSSSPNKHKTLDSNPPQNRQNSSPPGNVVSDTNPEESNGTKQVKENGSCVQDPNLSGSEKKMKTKVINVEDRVALLKSKMSELKKKAGDFDLRPVASWGEGECVPFMFLYLVFDIISNKLRQILITDIVCNMLRTVMVTTQAGFAGFDVFGCSLILGLMSWVYFLIEEEH